MALTTKQIQENVAELKKQGAPKEVVESYLKQAFEKPDLGIDSETFKNDSVGGKAARFLGIEKIGSFIGSNLAKLDPQHRQNLATVEQEDPEAARILSRGGDVTNRELVGSALNLAGNVALPFAGKALNAGGIGARVAKGATVGAGFGASGGLESGQDNSGVLLSAMIGGTLGGAIPLAGATIKTLARKAEGIPEKLYNTIFKNSQDDVFRMLKTQGDASLQKTDPVKFAELVKQGIIKVGKDGIVQVDETLAKQALDRGLRGNISAMANKVVDINRTSELGVRNITKNYKPLIKVENKKGLLNVLEGIRSQFTGQYDEKLATKEVSQYIKQVKTGKVTADTLMNMRRLIDKQRVAASYRDLGGKISLSQESYKAAADALRSKLNNLPGMGSVMKDYSFSIEALEALAKEAQRKGNAQVLGMIDSILFTGGATAGGPLVGAGSFLARKTLSSAPVATGLAQGLNTLGRATAPMRSLTATAIEKSKPLARTASANVIGKTGRVLGN